MKRISYVLFTLALAVVASSASAQVCYWDTCQYQTDGQFLYGGTHWVEIGSASYPSVSTCGSNTLAQLDPGEGVKQTFSVGDHTVWAIDFRAYLPNDTDDFYDELKITVKNNNTNQSEINLLRGSDYDSSCNLVRFELQNNYDNASVTIEFKAGPFSQTWQVDDVVFSGQS